MAFRQKDIDIVRSLASRYSEIAALPIQQENKKLWMKLNRLERTRPLLYVNACEPLFWEEVMPDSVLECEDDFCRFYERDLRRKLFAWDHFADDRVIEDVMVCPIFMKGDSRIDGFGLFWESEQTDSHGAKHFKSIIDTEEDINKIQMPQIEVLHEKTQEHAGKMRELFGDTIRVEVRGPNFFWLPVGDVFAQWRGLDRMYMDIVERPEWLHECLNKITEGHISSVKQMEEQGVLSPNGPTDLGSGGFSWSDELRQDDEDGPITSRDLWCRLSTQMFTEIVSKETHIEFAVKYEERISELFGLTSYGCCEPLHNRIDMLKGIKNLRRVSISPFADIEKGAEALGKDYVFSHKPHPTNLAMKSWDPEIVRTQFKSAFEKTRDNIVDVTLQDMLTVRGDINRLTEWTKIARELSEEYA